MRGTGMAAGGAAARRGAFASLIVLALATAGAAGCSAGAQDTEFATDETALYNATTEKDKTLDIVPKDSAHGFTLLTDLLPKVEAFSLAHIS
jgi:hypothetical protein